MSKLLEESKEAEMKTHGVKVRKISTGNSENDGLEKLGKEGNRILPEDLEDDGVRRQGDGVRKNLQQASKDDEAKVQEPSKERKGWEESSVSLPENVLEKIVAMMPFPDILQARIWSKSWLARFSSIAALDEGEKLRVTLFQKILVESSTKWTTLPTYRWNCVVHDLVSQTLGRIPSLSSLSHSVIRSKLQIEGALCYFDTGPKMNELYVANILTGSWKQLPPRPLSYGWCILKKLINDESSETYRVVLCFVDQCRDLVHGGGSALAPEFMAQIYDSKSDAWISKNMSSKLVPLLGLSKMFRTISATAAHLNGVVYIVAEPTTILAFNVEEGTVERIRSSAPLTQYHQLVVCDASVLVINNFSGAPMRNEKGEGSMGLCHIDVQKIDLGSQEIFRLAYGPPPESALKVQWLSNPFLPVVDGDRVLLGVERPISDLDRRVLRMEPGAEQGYKGRVLVYNVKENHWSCFPYFAENEKRDNTDNWGCSSFRPCLKPFVEV